MGTQRSLGTAIYGTGFALKDFSLYQDAYDWRYSKKYLRQDSKPYFASPNRNNHHCRCWFSSNSIWRQLLCNWNRGHPQIYYCLKIPIVEQGILHFEPTGNHCLVIQIIRTHGRIREPINQPTSFVCNRISPRTGQFLWDCQSTTDAGYPRLVSVIDLICAPASKTMVKNRRSDYSFGIRLLASVSRLGSCIDVRSCGHSSIRSPTRPDA